jgi:hypothetical protein
MILASVGLVLVVAKTIQVKKEMSGRSGVLGFR